MKGRKSRTLFMAQFSILVAIEAIFCFTPLGSLPAIGPIVATLAHVPVIITALVLGTKAGALMGGVAGLFSFLVWTFVPPGPIAFVFTPFYSLGEVHGNGWSLVICFVPRILIGVVAGLVHSFFAKRSSNALLSFGLAGALGSLVNTFLVLGGVYLFFGRPYAAAIGTAYNLILGVLGMQILTSGIPEAIVGFIVGYCVCRPLKKAVTSRM